MYAGVASMQVHGQEGKNEGTKKNKEKHNIVILMTTTKHSPTSGSSTLRVIRSQRRC